MCFDSLTVHEAQKLTEIDMVQIIEKDATFANHIRNFMQNDDFGAKFRKC